MPLDRGQIELPDERVLAALKCMSPAQRLAGAHAMWRFARDRADTTVRQQRPDLSPAQTIREIRRRMLGPS